METFALQTPQGVGPAMERKHPLGESYLEVEGGEGARRYPLDGAPIFRIGRSADNDLVLDDAMASREHAVLRRNPSGCVLVDSGSRNGTLLNRRPVTAPARLADGDLIQIGAQRLRYRDLSAPGLPPQPTAAPGPAATMFIPQQSLITVLVIDIRGFTPLSAAIGEERISALMSTIFREAGALLDAEGCWSQKFIGDAVMAVWRHETDRLPRAELRGVLRTVAALAALFAELQARFTLPRPLVFGAAINTGRASLGNMGSGSSADFTALGDTVNKAFRLETASKALAVDIVVGEAVFGALAPPLELSILPPVTEVELKGYDAAQPARLFRFTDLPRLSAILAG